MSRARDIIQGAFEALRVYSPGEDVRGADMARGFAVLNQMVDSWSTESLTCFALLEQSAPLVAGQSIYKIGPQQDFDMPRPVRIADGPGAAYVRDGNNNRYPINVLPQDRWNAIWNLQSPTSNLPNTLFYDPQYPFGIINIYPVPTDGAMTLFWNSFLALTQFYGLQAEVQFPPGYEKAFQDNLAVELASYYPTAQLSPMLLESASRAKANVKRINIRENTASFDRAISSGGGGSYNVYSDSST